MKRSCVDCDFCGSMLTPSKTIATICRKNPPVVQVAMVMTPAGPQVQTLTAWPAVKDTDWCGEFKPKPMALAS